MGSSMNLYHRTYAAEAIISSGFCDGRFERLALGARPGVWMTDRPLDERDGALGNVVLVVSGVPEEAVADYEWLHSDDPQPFREFVVPAAVLNRYPIVGIYPDTWLWMSGEFEYVGSLIDMRPLLARTPTHPEPGESSRLAPIAPGLAQLEDH
jgi:hypothetical protein